MKGCFRLGLYKQGLLHDMSKYGPTEFLPGCKFYQGDLYEKPVPLDEFINYMGNHSL